MKISKLIKELKIDYCNSDITDKNFPDQPRKGLGPVELMKIDKRMTTQEIEDQMKREGYVAANSYELLEWATKNWNGKDWVVGLGSKWRDSSGNPQALLLWGDDDLRGLYLGFCRLGSGWGRLCVFARRKYLDKSETLNSESWEVTCRDYECHRLQKHKVGLHGAVVMPTQKGDICVECGKEEGPHEHEWYTPVGLKDYQICMKCEIPKSREKCSHNKSQPPQPKVRATCLRLDCPERTGGECRHQPPQPTQESWEIEFWDNRDFDGCSRDRCLAFIRQLIAKSQRESQNWEKQFDKSVAENYRGQDPYWPHWEEIKSFIRQLLANSKQETLDEIVEMAKEVRERFRCAACDGAMCGHTLGCQSLSDLLEKIKNIK